MKLRYLRTLGLITTLQLACWPVAPSIHAASAVPAAIKAKQEAEAKGYTFEPSHDEIVSKAKKEGRLRVLSSLEGDMLKPVAETFKKKYPFIELRAEEIGIPLVLSGKTNEILPVWLWIYWQDGFIPQASAIGVILIVLTGLIGLAARRLLTRTQLAGTQG